VVERSASDTFAVERNALNCKAAEVPEEDAEAEWRILAADSERSRFSCRKRVADVEKVVKAVKALCG
jgi:hypothetical protein